VLTQGPGFNPTMMRVGALTLSAVAMRATRAMSAGRRAGSAITPKTSRGATSHGRRDSVTVRILTMTAASRNK